MNLRLEHANIAVKDIEAMMLFLKTAFPDFAIRSEGSGAPKGRWVHFGLNETYVALNEADEAIATREPYSTQPGLNHLGYEVDNVQGLRERLIAGGYQESTVPNKHPHRTRVYFYDPEGNDWEFVEYHTDDRALRHDYDLPDF